MKFFDAFDATNSLGVPTGAPVLTTGGTLANTTNQFFISSFTFVAPVALPVDNDCFLQMEWRDPTGATAFGSGPLLPNGHGWRYAITIDGGAPFANTVGQTLPGMFIDRGTGTAVANGGDGTLNGAASIATIAYNGLASAGTSVQAVEWNDFVGPTNSGARIWLGLDAQLSAPTPTVFVDATPSCANATTITLTDSSAPDANGVRWFKFCTLGDATDIAASFLDISFNGSAPAGDVVAAVYGNDGTFVIADDNDGPGTLPQFSFGLGNRAAEGDGETFNGSDGELLGGQTFWVGVVEGPLTAGAPDVFGGGPDGFAIKGTNPLTGPLTMTIKTNSFDPISNPIAPSVPPSLTGGIAGDFGNLLFPGFPGTANDMNPPEVQWQKFTVCAAVAQDDANTDNWYDFDFGATAGGADGIAFLFNSSGVLVAESDDGNAAGGYFQPQLSFGNSSVPRPSAYTNAGQLAFAGQNGALAAGDYYLALTNFGPTRAAMTTATNDRWFVRPEVPADSIDLAVDLLTGVVACSSGPTCNDLDFNNDGNIEPLDVDAYFSVLGEGPCLGDIGGGCDSLDFNNDGNIEPLDVDSYFSVLGEGPCI